MHLNMNMVSHGASFAQGVEGILRIHTVPLGGQRLHYHIVHTSVAAVNCELKASVAPTICLPVETVNRNTEHHTPMRLCQES